MPQENSIIKNIIEEAIRKFNENEKYLLENDLSERCICAKFMSYLEHEIKGSPFYDYKVDVEYNRGNNGNTSALKQLEGKNIVVDLIIHKREIQRDGGFDNLVCIEMKKARYKNKINADISRLEKMTCYTYGFNYQAGFMIIIDKTQMKIAEEFYL